MKEEATGPMRTAYDNVVGGLWQQVASPVMAAKRLLCTILRPGQIAGADLPGAVGRRPVGGGAAPYIHRGVVWPPLNRAPHAGTPP
jgi:hypothetical protein